MKRRRLTERSSLFLCLIGCLAAWVVPASAEAAGTLELILPPVEVSGKGDSGEAVILSVVDNRKFSDKPATPDIPTFYKGVSAMTPGDRRQVIGRERDASGKAKGNVFLKEGATVESIVGDMVRHALVGLGCKVLDGPASAGPEAMRIYVIIDKFWGWVRVEGGFFGTSMYMDAALSTDLDIERHGERHRTTVSAEATNRLGIGVSDRNWLKTYRVLLGEYAYRLRAGLGP